MNADRNLLFGILAFQNNFIDRQALLAAFDRWTGDKSKPLGEILVEEKAISADEYALLDALVGKHLDRHDGNAEKSLAAVTPVGSIRDELKQLADPDVEASLAHVSMAPVARTFDATLTWTAGSPTLAGARFRVLRSHAKGGLGEVFVAHDEELDREVAFKEIQDRHADNPDSRGRFLLEAKVTGGLEHPGIVPVYGLGSYADGRPFYAMRFIKGDSLKEAIKRFHQANAAGRDSTERTAELRRLLGRFIDVCNAIEYAHSRGVLHRDLKPGNIMLGNYGETLVVDWGLAKVMGRSETPSTNNEPAMKQSLSSGSAATQMGQAIGTPQYMSPEQAAGRWDELGRESDVYSLGATLYTLLTGQAPIGDSESMDVLARAAKGDFPAPRTLEKEIPPALEAICLKAMALKPIDRYQSPRALADDIECWLNDQPVSVHRDPFSRQMARWVRNHKATTSATAAAVVVLFVGGIIASAIARRATERTENVTRANGLVETLVNADPQQVPEIIKQIGAHEEWTKLLLEKKLAGAKDGSTQKLNLSLALVAGDERQIEYLYEQLLSSRVSYTGILRNRLAPYEQRFQGDLWNLLRDTTKQSARRLRAGLALAGYVAASEHWTSTDITFLAEQLVAANPEQQPRIREYLRSLEDRMLGDLERIFSDPMAKESHQLGAANALVEFAGEDAVRLARLLSAATPGQYEILYPVVTEARDATAHEFLIQSVRETPAEDLPAIERVSLGKRRAGAAITLLRQGEHESILDVLRVHDDPESLTQFIHRCRQRGILPPQLLECVKRADDLRQTKTGAARRTEDGVLYALILALGEFELAELPKAQRDTFVEQLVNWYGSDPSSAIHGATGWLLRYWGKDELAKNVDQTLVPYAPNREWYTLQINAKTQGLFGLPGGEQNLYITFVIFPPGEYVMGSVPDEADREITETRHAVKLTRPIAVSDREITWEQFNAFDSRHHQDNWEKQYGHALTPEEPVFGVSWYEAVAYCRWLTKCAGMAEDDQAYADPASLDRERFPADPDPLAAGAPRNWPVNLEKSGFRLPTEAEWEMVCRGGTTTDYSFGNDPQLLAHYGWFQENSDKWSHTVGKLRPTARGLFDIHGNLLEWCHDWWEGYGGRAAVEDPTGPAAGSNRVYRGSGWFNDSSICRSATRRSIQPTIRTNFLGFRVAAVPFSQARVSASAGPSEIESESREAE